MAHDAKSVDKIIYQFIWNKYKYQDAFLNYYNPKPLFDFPDNAILPGMPLRFYIPNQLQTHQATRIEQLSRKPNMPGLVWTSCDDIEVKNLPNLRLLYQSCGLSDHIHALKKIHLMQLMLQMNGRLYAVDTSAFDINKPLELTKN